MTEFIKFYGEQCQIIKRYKGDINDCNGMRNEEN